MTDLIRRDDAASGEDMGRWLRAALSARPATPDTRAVGAKPLGMSDDLRGQLWQVVLKMTACDDDGCGQNNCACMARYARIIAAIPQGDTTNG